MVRVENEVVGVMVKEIKKYTTIWLKNANFEREVTQGCLNNTLLNRIVTIRNNSILSCLTHKKNLLLLIIQLIKSLQESQQLN